MTNTTKKPAAIPSGYADLDTILGGGYPRGRIVEVYGPENCGTFELMLRAVAAAQEKGLRCAIVDFAGNFDPSVALALGVELDKLLLEQPETVLDALAMAQQVMLEGVDLVVYTWSLGMVFDAMGRYVSLALRSLCALTHSSGTTLIIAREERQRIGPVFGPRDGGHNAIRFYASVRVDVRRSETDEGKPCRLVRTVKNKCGEPFRSCELPVEAR